MGMAELFGFGSGAGDDTEIPDIYPFTFKQSDFVDADTFAIYSKILTDVIARTHGLKDEQIPLLWDNCLASENSEGLITMLATAMVGKKELFLIYDPALKLVRRANQSEESQIKADYAKTGESKAGIFVSFKRYTRTDMVKLYAALEYYSVASLSKSMNLSKAIQVKISDLRASVSLGDSVAAKAQAKVVATALSEGRDVVMDAKDLIDTTKPDLTATEQAQMFITQKRAFYLGMPASYLTGETKKAGLSDTGEGDAKQIERGLKGYFYSIIRPTLTALFSAEVEFQSNDFRMLDVALNALKTFELNSGELLSKDNQRIIVNKLLDLPEDEKGDEVVAVEIDPLTGQPKSAAPFDPKAKPPAKKAV